MFPRSSFRIFLLALVTALPAAAALVSLPISGSPVLTASPPAAVQELVTAPAAPAPPPAPAGLQQARPVPAEAVVPATAGRPAGEIPAPLVDLLRRQAAAGLSCELTARQLPVCGHGGDDEPLQHDHSDHPHDGPSGAAGTAHGPAGSTTGTTGSIGCYGDGTSGPRVRAIYARPQSAPDRYAASAGSIRGWAAGVSNHFDTSAARTKGRRHVRFATTGGKSCSVTVLNVTLPDDAFASFTATINALQARGLDAPGSKYLVWADTTGYCGVATTYADDKAQLDNLNNGSFPTYARVDRRCWGKVETHEVVHMLGGVQRSARNSTDGGHCNDGTDLMCYADGTARSAQRTVCGSENAELLDCRNDDYFSTAAPKGSYLQTHWNVARSSFLSSLLSDPPPSPTAEPAPATSATPSPAPSPAPEPAPQPAGGGLSPALPLPLPTLAPALLPALNNR